MTYRLSCCPALALSVLVLVGCERLPHGSPPRDSVAEHAVDHDLPECRNGASRLALSGLCPDVATASLDVIGGAEYHLPDGCEWVIQESWFVDQFLLYLAAQCGATTSRLSLEVGARTSEIFLQEAAIGMASDEVPVIRVISTTPGFPLQSPQALARSAIEDPFEAENCVARPANVEGWPEDAIVVDLAQRADALAEESEDSCGPFGFHVDETAYWRVFNDFSWYFSLGQDHFLDFDPRTLTLIDAELTPYYNR